MPFLHFAFMNFYIARLQTMCCVAGSLDRFEHQVIIHQRDASAAGCQNMIFHHSRLFDSVAGKMLDGVIIDFGKPASRALR
jgi:hypothetical protein